MTEPERPCPTGARIIICYDTLVPRSVTHVLGSAGYYVFEAEGCAGGCQLALTLPDIQLLITHLGPGRTTPLSILRLQKRAPELAILTLGGLPPVKGPRTAVACGLAEPFTAERLLPVVAALLRRSPRPGAPQLRSGEAKVAVSS